jgi:hypothetical protein
LIFFLATILTSAASSSISDQNQTADESSTNGNNSSPQAEAYQRFETLLLVNESYSQPRAECIIKTVKWQGLIEKIKIESVDVETMVAILDNNKYFAVVYCWLYAWIIWPLVCLILGILILIFSCITMRCFCKCVLRC